MNEFMKILMSLSVSGTLLLLLIWGLKPFYKKRFSQRWQYYIWIIVALRFMLPYTSDTAIVGRLFESFGTATIMNEISISPNVPISVITDKSEKESLQINEERTNISMHEPFDIYICLFFIWSAAALVLFVRKVTVYQGYIQYIKAGNTEVSDIEILNLLSDCEEKLKIKTKVELSCNPLIASPIMTGFFRPVIVLPACKLEETQLTYIFMHELIHYKQRDMFYKWLIQVVVCVHWFNPLVYLLEKEVNKCCELSCDEKVISLLDDKARREYGDMLISFLRPDNRYKSSLASVTLTEEAKQLKERLGAIMDFNKKNKVIWVLTGVLTLCIIFVAAFVGSYRGVSASVPANQKHQNQHESQSNKETMSIVHESAEVLYYEDGSPYIHDIITNNTDKGIIETEYCMLAYDEKGSPLKLHWNFPDSSTESSYENLVRTKTSILPGQTEDYHGGWSLYDGEQMENLPKTQTGEAAKVVYPLFCLKQVVFEDGTVWNNPDYENWFKAYAGKKAAVTKLQNYYPYKYELKSE